jgi:pimeloyl-ACP methyl ester carboxylesterase
MPEVPDLKDIIMNNPSKLLALFLLIAVCIHCIRNKSIHEPLLPGELMLSQSVFKTGAAKYHADRGLIWVPESRSDTNTRLISLPVIQVHSLSQNPSEPIFYLAGGPGQTNMKFKPPDELLVNHDFVLVGYRGVDGSARLDCPEVKKAIKGTGRDLLDNSSLSNLDKAFCDCAARIRNEGFNLNAYTMPDVIQDMESVRTALGYDHINLLSQSYGARIAQIYGYKYPGTISRSVMIGVNPPGRFVWEPSKIDQQLDYYSHLWSQDQACRLRSKDLTLTMRNVLQKMPGHWLFFRIDPGKVKLISFALLYHRKTAAQVFDTYIAAEKGDPSGLAMMTLAYDFMFPKMITWGDLAAKAISADFDTTRNYALEMDPPSSIMGSPFSKLLWSLSDWPTAPIPEEYRKVQPSSVPTLMLSGSVDFATPAEYATEQLLPQLKNGRQIIMKELGHTHDIWNVQRAATVCLITGFFDTGVADDSRITYSPMDFNISWGFPAIAKLAVIIMLLLLLGFIFLIYQFIRKFRRIKSSLLLFARLPKVLISRL